MLTIRPAGQGDLPALLELYDHLIAGEAPPSLSAAAAILEQFSAYRGSVILVGYVGDRLVGSCALVVIPNLTRGGRPYGLIENVVTHAAARRRGHGQAMLASAVEQAWHFGCYKVMLLTGSNNPSTLRFYQSVGFEQTKTGFQMRRLPARNESRS